MSVALQHRASILADIASGKRLSDIAPSYGVSPQAISRSLKDDKEYREAIESSFACRLDRAEDAIQEAIDNVDVARARAYWSSIAWRAEREVSERWGGKAVQVNIGLVSLDPATIGGISSLLERLSPAASQHVIDQDSSGIPK